MDSPYRPTVVSLLLLNFALAACSTPSGWLERTCAPGQQRQVSETLYFGTSMPDGTVPIQEWDDFLRDVVTPRFPDGLTVWSASGQWRGADGTIVREPTYVLNLVHDGSAAALARVDEISSDYKRRFQQEAVLDTRAEVCTSF